MNKIQPLPLDVFENFHKINLFLPTRTIYFGGMDEVFKEDSDVVDSVTVGQLIKNLHILESLQIAPISILLNSCGGEWESGIAVYDLIKSLKSSVTIVGLGKVYSMASIILQAGDHRILTENTSVLVHDGSDGFVGETKNFERWAEVSKKTRQKMYQIYYERMVEKNKKITFLDIEKLCSCDIILTAKNAIEIGLADEIISKVKKTKQ